MTVCGLLHADAAVRDNGGCCVAFEPRKSMYDKMTSENIYKTNKNATASGEEIENVFSDCRLILDDALDNEISEDVFPS